MIERTRLRSALAWLIASALGARVLGSFTGVVTARALGPQDRGTFALLLLAGLVGGAVASGGMDVWAARTLARGADAGIVMHTLRRHQLSALVLAVIAAAIVVGTTGADPIDTAVTAGLGWFTSSAVLKLGLLQGADRMRSYSWSTFAGAIAYATAVCAVAVFGQGTVRSFLFAAVLGKAVTAAWRFRPVRGQSTPAKGEEVAHRTALAFGATTMLGGLVTLGLYRLDVAIVAALGSTSDAGVYSVALAVAEVLWVLPTSAAQAVLPRASAISPTVDTAKVNRVIIALMVILAVLVSVAGPVVIPLVFGAAYSDAAVALPALAAGSVAVGSWKLLAHDLLARGDARTRLYSGVIGLVTMVSLDLFLVPRLGILGASLGSLGGYATAAAITVQAWRHRTGTSVKDLLVMRRDDVATLTDRPRSSTIVATDPLIE